VGRGDKLIHLGCGKLVLVDQAEASLLELAEALRVDNGFGDVVAVLADIRSARRAGEVLDRHGPDVVFHAAANKHLRLVEARPIDGVASNVLATEHMVRAARRVGYGYAGAEMAALLNRVRQPFNVNAIGQAAAVAALDDREFTARCRRENRAGMVQLGEGFKRLGLEFVPSVGNFILARVGDGGRVFDALQRRGVIVRPVKSYGLPEWIRVTVGTREQNERLLRELAAARA